VQLAEFTRSTTFRWTIAVAGAFALSTLLLFGFVYWQAARYMTMRIDGAMTQEIGSIANASEAERRNALDERLRQDPRRVKLAGLFTGAGQRIEGNIESVPANLDAGAPPRDVAAVRIDASGREAQKIRAVARRLPNGDLLVLGHNIDEIGEMAEIVGRSLALGALPALCLSIVVGFVLSARGQTRVEEVARAAERIVAGHLRERLPTRQVGDPFDKLAAIVNGMLDEIEKLIHEIAGVGDDIAHDLRTPLTRVRAILERGRDNAQSREELQLVVDRAIIGLDQSLAIITALLRIAEIEHGRRLAGFGRVELAEIVEEVAELYAPIAEDRGVQLRAEITTSAAVRGDRDLLFEAIANLVDNAVKFTPAGGQIDMTIMQRPHATVVRISDNGPGIEAAEREAVIKRFYRSDKSRHTQGIGLGLSLVAAIVKLHGFELTIGDGPGPGCVIEIACPSRNGA
jgi:signal transduction histidine kinase